MSVRMKITSSKTRSRRSHHALASPTLTKTESGVRRRHFADPATGMYRGRAVGAKARAQFSPKTPSSSKKAKIASKKGE